MSSLKEYRQEQIGKINKLKSLGVNPYPADSHRDASIVDVVANPDKYKEKLTLAGRLLAIRTHGGVVFLDIEEGCAKLQVIAREDDLVANYPIGNLAFADINLLTRGDFIEVFGQVGLSQRGELSIMADSVRVLAKVLRPLPEKLEDKETRLRRRYLDMAVNPEIRQRFIRRSKFWQATRDFLNQRGFCEINIPVLEHTTGGADANPFVTKMDALDEEFYLRISHELPLKRLIGGGLEKVYDLGPRFRNENYTDEHLPEHVAMEWYWAYADWRDGMQLMEEMFLDLAQKAFGKKQFSWQGQTIDFEKQWERWDYTDVVKDRYGIDVFNTSIEEVSEQLKKNGLEVEKTDSIPRGIDKLWKNIRKDVVGPIWLINTPKFISPLSKASDDNPEYVQRFQAVFAGSEQCNGWSELNDPQDQLGRFIEQQQMRDEGDDEAQMLDIDYVEMLEYGMPPACGLGFSERVFWVLEGVTAREGVPFPQLRREFDDSTIEIYSELNLKSNT